MKRRFHQMRFPTCRAISTDHLRMPGLSSELLACRVRTMPMEIVRQIANRKSRLVETGLLSRKS
jgi:hypothetical protein